MHYFIAAANSLADDVADGPDTIPATAAAISLADDVIDCDNSDLLIVPVTMKRLSAKEEL